MTRSRAIALVVFLALAGYDFSFRPQRLVDSFKALRCCREHCQKSGPISAAERCCGVAQDQAGLRAVHTNAADIHAAAADIMLPGAVDVAPALVVEALVIATCEPSRAPPIFLSNQAFLL
jgi:hypothetical protein